MGIASSLFFSSDASKVTLHRRITPNDDQFEFQKQKWNALAEHLVEVLKDESGCRMRTWLQGSYKFGTQIRPARKGGEFDIDLGVYFDWSGEPDDGDHEPGDLREMVQEGLEGYEDEDAINVVHPPKRRCCRIRYHGDFHIDVPAYHIDADRDARTLAAGSEWEDSDPKKLYLWFKDQCDDAKRAKVRRQIRYLKCWSCLRRSDTEGRPSSTLLTVLVTEAVVVPTGPAGPSNPGPPNAIRPIVENGTPLFDVAVFREGELVKVTPAPHQRAQALYCGTSIGSSLRARGRTVS